DNNVTFQPASGDSTDVVLTYESVEYDSNYVVLLAQHASYIAFRHLTIHPTGTNYGRGIVFGENASNITIANCHFKGIYSTGNQNEYASVFGTETRADYMHIYNNRFDSVAIGIYLNGRNTDLIEGMEVLNNQFIDMGYESMLFRRAYHGTIEGNVIQGGYIGIHFGTGYERARIQNNRIICKKIGITYTSAGSLSETGLIANNYIFITDQGGHCRGLFIGGQSPVNIYHNTVILGDGGLDDHALSLTNFPGDNLVNVTNNIFACLQGGYAYYNSYHYNPVDTLDYNNYYTAGQFLGNENGKQLFNLNELRNYLGKDQHSFTAFPVFSADTSVYPITNWLNNKGIPISRVAKDIDGKPRDETNPDVGAVEFTPPAHATPPYAGDYTIGPGADFDSLAQAIDSLLLKGVSGEVRLNFSSGTHIVHTEIPAIPGTNYDKNLVLQSESGNCDDVLIKYEEQSNTDNGYVITCHGTDFMTVRNLSFKADRVEGPYSRYARVFKFFGGTENLTFTDNHLKSVYHPSREHYAIFFTNDKVHYYDSLVIANNELDSCAVGIYFQSYGQLQQKKSVKAHIVNNELFHVGRKGFHFQNHNGPTIKNNIIDSETIGIYLSNCINNTTITGNQISAGNDYGIGMTVCKALDTSRGLVANNFITAPGSFDTQGINMLGSEHFDVVYNSVHVTSDDGGARAIHTTSGTGNVILNNIFSNVGGGYAAKYERASAIDSLDYNDYYTAGNDLAVWESTVCPDLDSLQSASGMDQHALSVDPGFVSDDDLHLNSPAVSEHATPIPFVTTDIDGEERDPSSPDMGADEAGSIVVQPELMYVDDSAEGNNDGSSWADAFSDLQSALDVSVPGDTIWIAEGTYHPSKEFDFDNSEGSDPREATFHIPEQVKLYGGFQGTETGLDQRNLSAYKTILNGDIGTANDSTDNAYHVVYAGNNSLLNGLTITGGVADLFDPDPANNYNSVGGGIITGYHSGDTTTIIHCTLTENTAIKGGGLWSSGHTTLQNCLFINNHSMTMGGGAYCHSNSQQMHNCVFMGNKSNVAGGALFCATKDLSLVNCTMSGNYAEHEGGAIFMNDSSHVAITNSIFWNNLAATGNELYFDDQSSAIILYSDIEEGQAGFEGTPDSILYQNNLSDDPLFVNQPDPYQALDATGDLHLLPASPCIDAGMDDSVQVFTDAEGNTRIQGDRVDMGAYEGSVEYAPKRIYVDVSASGEQDGTSWAKAYNDLQVALDSAYTGDTIWVAEGTYHPSKEYDFDFSGGSNPRETTFHISKNLFLFGGFQGTETSADQRNSDAHRTLLSGDIGTANDSSDNAYHVVSFDAKAVFDGFTVKGGFATTLDPIHGNDYNAIGGGIYVMDSGSDTVYLVNCTIKGNTAITGGGIYAAGNTDLRNCRILQNKASEDGGGMYGTAGKVMHNCLVMSNYAGKAGGGIYGSANSLTMINGSMSGNYSGNRGGAMHLNDSGQVNLVNCILWNNHAANGPELYCQNKDSLTIRYSNVEGGQDSIKGTVSNLTYSNNLDANPRFVTTPNPLLAPHAEGNLHLTEYTPCLDAGLNDPVILTTDLDGNARIQKGTVDMGAYEGYEPNKVIHVDGDAGGLNDGTSWTDAFRYLQNALDKASPGDTVWVAEGTYYPDQGEGVADNYRDTSFAIPAGVALYGGFDGTEGSLEERDWKANETILNGDIDEDDSVQPDDGNAYHVVYFYNVGDQ
ncbi:MAG: right-handed parallel beta-helix repeat-containing protein, partial [Bacteroidales bacterium]